MVATTTAIRATPYPNATYEAGRVILDTEENEADLFNNESRTTQNVRIIGEDVILEKGVEPYDTVHENPAIKRLNIYAERVTIRSPLHLPQTAVSIYARELRFEDVAGLSSFSYLSTTPVAYSTGAEPARREGNTVRIACNGNSGAKAGDVVLRCESFHASDPEKNASS
ncbi:MAG: hypothetical protein H6965_12100 [Chromatiaceae bacterium]|nr:hypothetical protein [Chromatiaceae bacterium]